MAKDRKKTTKSTIPMTVGKPSIEIEKAWLNEQIPYVNFAGKNEDLDNRASALVQQHCNSYRERMSAVFDRWALNWRCANGDVPWLTTMDGVHVFEPQKRLRSKCARIVRAIQQFDPPFVVEGGNSEVDLVRSGLEATMIDAFAEMKAAMKTDPTIKDLRTAAYVVAIDKVAKSYLELGIFP